MLDISSELHDVAAHNILLAHHLYEGHAAITPRPLSFLCRIHMGTEYDRAEWQTALVQHHVVEVVLVRVRRRRPLREECTGLAQIALDTR